MCAQLSFRQLEQLTFCRGRAALYAILKGLGIGRGDEVATQAFTCVAVPEGIQAAAARPLFIDIEADGYNVDANDLRRKVGKDTRAVIVQHTFGIPANMQPILAVAKEANIPVIEDCCHTLASSYRGQTVGTFGIAAFYSFEWGKPIIAGLGGSAVVHDAVLRETIAADQRQLRTPAAMRAFKLELQYLAFALLYRPRSYWTVRSLFHWLAKHGAAEGNYHAVDEGNVSEDFSIAMPPRFRRRLARKLNSVAAHAEHAASIVDDYRAGLSSSDVIHPELPTESEAVFARYPIRVPDKPRYLSRARASRIELAEWYSTPIHPLGKDAFKVVNYEPQSCPHAERRAEEVVSLPTHGKVSRDYAARSIEFLARVA